MASVPQTKFTIVLPTQDQAVPPNPIVVGELTEADVEITVDGATTVYSTPLDPNDAVGASIDVPFTSLTPTFSPVAGKSYVADAFVKDAAGAGAKSKTVSWTQLAAAAAPAAPSDFSVG
jgi:hypothetical protein